VIDTFASRATSAIVVMGDAVYATACASAPI
jgi:hypothetical protein